MNRKIVLGKRDYIGVTSIPGMRESIREGICTAIKECDEEPGW